MIAVACGPAPEDAPAGPCDCWPTSWSNWRSSSRSARTPCARTEKNELKPWLKEQWVLPKPHDADYVAAMEDVLEVYQRPYDEQRPVVCVDEATKQLVANVTPPLPMEPGQPARQDYEYERRGTANLFMVCEPLAGRRRVKVTEHRARRISPTCCATSPTSSTRRRRRSCWSWTT